MAVTDPNKTQTQQQAPQQQQAQQQQQRPQQNQQQQGQQQQSQSVVNNISSLLQRSGTIAGGDTRAAEALQIFTELREDSIKNQELESDFAIQRFDRDAQRVGISSLLVVKTTTLNGVVNAAVRVLMLPNSAIKLANTKVPYNAGTHQEMLEIEVTPRDVFSANYWARVTTYIRNSFNNPKMNVVNAGAFVVPAEFDLKETHVLQQLLVRSVNLCDDMLMRLAGERPFTVAMVKGQDEILTASMDFSGEPQHDQLGNPVRSDIVVSLNRSKRGQETENEFYEADTQLNQVSVMVDLEYQAPQQQALFGQQQQMAPQAPCTAAVIITDIRNAPWIKANTLELHLFGMTNAFRTTTNQAWARKFLPEVGKSKDLHDVGALGWLSPVGKKIETKSETFSQQNFADLMYGMVRPNPTFMIDLDDMGDNSVIDSVWIDALGGPNAAKAKQIIIQAANNLIGADLKQWFDYTAEPLLQVYGSKINKGYYFDGDIKRDRRDLDVLGALNAADGDYNEWMSWYAALIGSAAHPEVRNKQLKNYDRQYLGQVTYTGRAVRAMLNPKFIEGMDKAIAAAGVAITMDNVAMAFGAQRFQGNEMIANFAVSGQATVSTYQGNQPMTQNQYGGVSNGFY